MASPNKKRRLNSPEIASGAEANMSSFSTPNGEKLYHQDLTIEQPLVSLTSIADSSHHHQPQDLVGASPNTTTHASLGDTAQAPEDVRQAYRKKHDPATLLQQGGYLKLLPPELRNRIYEEYMLLVDKKVVCAVNIYPLGSTPPLLRAAKWIRDEARSMFLHHIFYTATVDLSCTKRRGASQGLKRLKDSVRRMSRTDWQGIMGLRLKIVGYKQVTLWSITELMSAFALFRDRGLDVSFPLQGLKEFKDHMEWWETNRLYSEDPDRFKIYVTFCGDFCREETLDSDDEDADYDDDDFDNYRIDEALKELWAFVVPMAFRYRALVEGAILNQVAVAYEGGFDEEFVFDNPVGNIGELWGLSDPSRPGRYMSRSHKKLIEVQEAGGLSLHESYWNPPV